MTRSGRGWPRRVCSRSEAERLRADDADDDNAYGPFKMGIQSYSLRHFKLDEALAMTKDLGLHYWESYPAHIPADAAQGRRNARRRPSDDGVEGHRLRRGRLLARTTTPIASCSSSPRRWASATSRPTPTPDSFDSLDKLVEEYGIADRHPQPRPRASVRQDRHDRRGDQGPSPRSAAASTPATSSDRRKTPSAPSRSSTSGSTAST